MKNNGDTQLRLIESAKTEFLENGFMKASLRKICSNAGVTTGALYFFFKDKEDLFAAIVEPPLNTLITLLKTHFAEDELIMSEPDFLKMFDTSDNANDIELAVSLIHLLYDNYDEFMLLLTKAQGSRFENCVDDMVDMIENTYFTLANVVCSNNKGIKPDKYMHHWLSHLSIDAFIHLITHEPDEKNATRLVKPIMECIVNAWMSLAFTKCD